MKDLDTYAKVLAAPPPSKDTSSGDEMAIDNEHSDDAQLTQLTTTRDTLLLTMPADSPAVVGIQQSIDMLNKGTNHTTGPPCVSKLLQIKASLMTHQETNNKKLQERIAALDQQQASLTKLRAETVKAIQDEEQLHKAKLAQINALMAHHQLQEPAPVNQQPIQGPTTPTPVQLVAESIKDTQLTAQELNAWAQDTGEDLSDPKTLKLLQAISSFAFGKGKTTAVSAMATLAPVGTPVPPDPEGTAATISPTA